MAEEKKLKRGLSLPMAVFIIIGMVIGSSIWVSPAAYLSRTGPSIFIAYMIAAIPGIFLAYIIAYLGSAFPVAGGTYVINSRLTGGFGGFMTVWMIILGVAASLAFLAATFAVFVGQIFNVPHDMEILFTLIVGIVVLLAFYFLNWIKIQISGLVELIITIFGDILVMLIFIFTAIPHFDPTNFDPLFPLGIEPLFFASLTFFFSYTGFNLILDVAGEVKKPQKNIPRSLLISIPILTILYTLQAFMVAGVQDYSGAPGTVTEIILSGGILPEFAVIIVTVLIAIAIASTLHPLYMAFSRDIMMAAREQLFPKKLSKLHEKQHTPVPALTVLLIAGIILLVIFIPLLAPSYGVETTAVLLSAVTGTVVLLLSIPVCISAIFLPKKYPKWHENSGFKPSLKSLKIMGAIGAIVSFIFVMLLFTDPDAGLIIALIVFPFAGVGAIIYFIRKSMLAKKGVNINEIVKIIPEIDIEEEDKPSKVEKLADTES